MALTNRNIVIKPDITIDPIFFVPPDVVDVRPKEQNTGGEDTDAQDNSAEGEEDIGGGDVVRPKLVPPDTAKVIKQVVKIGRGGVYTVDVYVEVPDQDGVESYEMRVTKK